MSVNYNYSIGAYEAIASDSLTILSALTAFIRIDILEKRKEKQKDENIPENP